MRHKALLCSTVILLGACSSREMNPTSTTRYTPCPLGGPNYEGVTIDRPTSANDPKAGLVLDVGEVRRITVQISRPVGPDPACGLWGFEDVFRGVSWVWGRYATAGQSPKPVPQEVRFVSCSACEVVTHREATGFGGFRGLARNSAAGTYVFDIEGLLPGNDSFAVFVTIGFCEAQGPAPATMCGPGSYDSLSVSVRE